MTAVHAQQQYPSHVSATVGGFHALAVRHQQANINTSNSNNSRHQSTHQNNNATENIAYVFDEKLGRKRRHDPWFAALSQQHVKLQQQQQQPPRSPKPSSPRSPKKQKVNTRATTKATSSPPSLVAFPSSPIEVAPKPALGTPVDVRAPVVPSSAHVTRCLGTCCVPSYSPSLPTPTTIPNIISTSPAISSSEPSMCTYNLSLDPFVPAHFLQQEDEVVSAGVALMNNNSDVSLSTTSSEEWLSEVDLESGSESDTSVALQFGVLDSLAHPLFASSSLSLSPTISLSDSDVDFTPSSSPFVPSQQQCYDAGSAGDVDVVPLSQQEVDWLSGLFAESEQSE
jgi:hypothetical protein